MQYEPDLGILARNDYYNQVGFGDGFDLTATDKLALNFLYSCPDIKKKIFLDFKVEEMERFYVELMQLQINPNQRSAR